MKKDLEIIKERNAKAKELGLKPKQKLFAELYASTDEFFANGTQSYIEAYKPKRVGSWYRSAISGASENLTKPNIVEYVNYLLEMRGLNDGFVDKQLEFLVTQHTDFKRKLGEIHEYNQLKKRTESGGNKVLVINVTGETARRYGIDAPRSPEGSSE